MRGLVPAVALALAAHGCAPARPLVPPVRFANAPPVRLVDDRRDVPTTPATREFVRYLFHLDGQFLQPLLRAFELPTRRRALGVNAIDEVPDSTWFTNRIGVREVTPAEIAAAPGGVGSPADHRPWTIESSKIGGQSVGFIVRDSRGERWLVKFDERGFPELETGAHVISGKLLWAAGYNVTEDYIVYLHRGDLVLDEHAVSKDVFGNKRPLDVATVDERLRLVDTGDDGRIRALVSHMLAGKPIGGHPARGTRADDPNDRIAHERRRDLRGAHTVFAWLDHQDIHEGNYLDMWIHDPRDRRLSYVKHYFIDFGNSLGVMPVLSSNLRRSTEYYVDYPAILTSLLTLGTVERRWEKIELSPFRGVGALEGKTFDPGSWKPTNPSYVPFLDADRFDKFWGAKLVMRFTREQIRAAVDAGQLRDPRAREYLVDTLVARQRAIGRYWFARVAPIDGAQFESGGLCFDDLALEYRLLRPDSPTSYTVESYDIGGMPLSPRRRVAAGPTGQTCAVVDVDDLGDGYTIVKISIERAAYAGETYVHVARDPHTRQPRVIGLWRP